MIIVMMLRMVRATRLMASLLPAIIKTSVWLTSVASSWNCNSSYKTTYIIAPVPATTRPTSCTNIYTYSYNCSYSYRDELLYIGPQGCTKRGFILGGTDIA